MYKNMKELTIWGLREEVGGGSATAKTWLVPEKVSVVEAKPKRLPCLLVHWKELASPNVQTITKITAKRTTNNMTKNKEYGLKDEEKGSFLEEEEGGIFLSLH